MKRFLSIIFFFIIYSFNGWSQGNMITINSTVPAQMTICGTSQLFTITIYNPSPFLLTNDTLKLNMPSGMIYQLASVTGATEFSTATPNKPVFLLPNIPTLTSITITFFASAGCDLIAYTAGGGLIQNDITVNYTGNGNQTYDDHTSATYLILQPNLSIASVTNQSYTGNIGDVFTRCITIINGGVGELSQFNFTDVHGSGIQINAVSIGTWTNTGITETVVLNGVDFSTIGDGDNLFENGESITICETVEILNCFSVLSAFDAYWGCNSQSCQSSVSSANVIFPNLIPNLVFTPNNGSIYAPMNTCIGPGNASQQELRIINTGLGQATNVLLEIFQATGVGYTSSVGSYIDVSSLTIQVGGGAAPVTIIPTSTAITSNLGCWVNQIGKVNLTIPSINPGDTIYIKWNTYSCCYDNCAGIGQNYINGWRYKGTYSNICQSSYIITEAWGRVYSQVYMSLTNNGSASTLGSGQTSTFNFLVSSYGHSFPAGVGANWEVEFTLPACLTYSGNIYFLSYNGVSTWSPTSVSVVGNVVTATFNGNPPFNLTGGELMIDLTVDCASCGGVGSSSGIGIEIFYTPDAACTCKVGVTCYNSPVSVICGSSCPEGMVFQYFEMKRTSYGLPDNEVGGGNGLPDVAGTLDFTKIKTGRAMFGDTITGSFNGTITTSVAHPFWEYCYASSTITNGNLISFVDATLTIYRAGVLIATCNSFTPTITDVGATRTFLYDLSAAPLAACLPLGFNYLAGDSVVFKPRYRVSVNVGGAMINCAVNNEYYVSDIANPTLTANKFQCNIFDGNYVVIGYYYTTWGPDNYALQSCNNLVISHNYYLSIGPCCNNYSGGNLFPYEYRNWAHISILTTIIPAGYTYVSAQFVDVRTSGTFASTSSATYALTPNNPNSDTLTFPVEQYFEGYGGIIPLSDDGFYGVLSVTVRPSCSVTPTIAQGIIHDWTFATTPGNQLTGPGSAATFITTIQDYVIYEAPDLFLQSTLPSVLAPNNTASWDISISNTSNVSNALNTWISGPAISGVSIIEVYDLDNSIVISPTGGIYQIGTVNASAVRNLRITADFTSCNQDSIIIHSGWNCIGYPSNISSYPCLTEKITLKLTPLVPLLIVNISSPPTTIELCDTASYTIQGVNIQLGAAYNVTLTTTLPVGVSIVPGSTQFNYPISNPYITISDPNWLGGTMWQWNISTIDSLIDTNGLSGILQSQFNSFNLTFNVITDCGYTSGSTIGFNLMGQSACGLFTGQEITLSSQLGITGATAPYQTSIDLVTTYISPCANNSTMKVVVHNNGPMAFTSTDSVIVQMPPGVSFVPGSFISIYNSPLNGVPSQFTLNGETYLVWSLPQGIALGDSTVFSFDYYGDPTVLACDIYEFEGHTVSSTNVICTLTGNSCGINIITGDTTLSVYTYKAYLSLSNGSAISIPNPPGGETVTINMDVTNTGQAILSGANSIIQFYYDANGNGIYDLTDIFISQDTLLVTNNSTVPYSSTFNVPGGQACSIIAIVDTLVNPCVCNPSQTVITVPLYTLGNDTTVCSGISLPIGSSPITGYTYTWTPTTGLNSSTISNPILTTSNLTSLSVVTDYILTTDRMGCIAVDTIQITTLPLPILNTVLSNIAVCDSDPLAMLTLTGDPAGVIFNWTGSVATIGLGSTGVGDIPAFLAINSTALPIIDSVTIIPSANGCYGIASIYSITVNPIPAVVVPANISVCNVDNVPITNFTSPTPGSTFSWTNSDPTIGLGASGIGDLPSFIATNTNTSVVTATITVVPSANGCTGIANTFTITVNPTPTVVVPSNITVCGGNNIPASNFTSSVVGATFTWTNSDPTIGIGANGTGDIPTFTAINIGSTLVTATIIVTSTANGCIGTPSSYTITVNPTSNVILPSNVIVCNGGNVSSTNFTSSVVGTTFTWTNSDPSIGIVANGTGDIPSFTASNIGSAPVIANVIVTPTSNGCIGTPSSYTITVNPIPTVVVPSNITVCDGGNVPVTNFTSPVVGTIYTWTNSDPSIGIGVNGAGDIPSFTASNIGSAPVTATIIVTPTFSGCLGTPGTYSITVNPTPTVVVPSNILVCNGGNVSATNFTSPVVGTIYTWTNSDPSIGIGANGTGDVLAFTATNNSSSTIVAIITVTPSFNGCVGITNTYTIAVDPNLIAIVPSNVIVCNGVNVQATNFTSAVAGVTFSWTNSDPSIGIGSNGTGNIPTFTAVNTGPAPVVSTVIVTPNYNGCVGIQSTYTITVNPLPVALFLSNTTNVCAPLCVTLSDISTSVGSSGINTWMWNVEEQNTSTNQNETYCFNTPGLYDVSLTVTTIEGCSSTTSILDYIYVGQGPEASFLYFPTQIFETDPTVNLTNTSSGAIAYLWDFGDGQNSTLVDLSYTYSDTGKYCISLEVVNFEGCKDTTSHCIHIIPEFPIYIPNSFTPNNDEINEMFMVYARGIRTIDARIYDRWGEEIYYFSDINNGWPGTMQNGIVCPMGVYVYKITIINILGKEFNFMGQVNLLR